MKIEYNGDLNSYLSYNELIEKINEHENDTGEYYNFVYALNKKEELCIIFRVPLSFVIDDYKEKLGRIGIVVNSNIFIIYDDWAKEHEKNFRLLNVESLTVNLKK